MGVLAGASLKSSAASGMLGEVRLAQSRELAEWVNRNTRRDATVMLEPLGMIGFYCDRRIEDYPGLASPRVTAAVEALGRPIGGNPRDHGALGHLLGAVRPDVLILREPEYEIALENALLSDYRLAYTATVEKRWSERYPILQPMLVLLRVAPTE
jgi:hypothetical protein